MLSWCRHAKTILSIGVCGLLAFGYPGKTGAQQRPQTAVPLVSITQLSDVEPTDWAFQAVQSLVERYSCISGHPSRLYRGNRALTRYEFAVGLNACLNRMAELVATGLADRISVNDLVSLQRLQEEFSAELVALKGRVDVLEDTIADEQSKGFSPVTKLNVELITALTGSSLSGDRVVGAVREGFDNGMEQVTFLESPQVVQESEQANMILLYRLRMNFDASFVGNDLLRIRLQARDASSSFFSGDPGFQFSGGGAGDIVIDDLFYQFRAFEDKLFLFGGLSSVEADEVFRYAVPWGLFSDFADAPNSTSDIFNGSALGLRYSPSDQFSIAYVYAARNAQKVGEFGGAGGAFAGDSAHQVELGFTPSDQLGFYFQAASSHIQDFADLVVFSTGPASGSNFFDFFRGPLSDPSGLENPVTGKNFPRPAARLNAFTIASTWEITPRFTFSGWLSLGTADYRLISAPVGTLDPGNEGVTGWLTGFLVSDVFLEGAEGTIVFGQSVTGDGIPSRPFILDVHYTVPLNDFISIRPGGYVVWNPNGDPLLDTDPTLAVGAIEAIFSF